MLCPLRRDDQRHILSGVLTGRAGDTYVNLTPHEEEKSYTVEVTVRDFAPVDPFVITFEHPVMFRDESLNPKKLKTPISKEPMYSVDDLLRVLAVENKTKRDLKTSVMIETGMKESTFNKLFRQLEATEGVTFKPIEYRTIG